MKQLSVNPSVLDRFIVPVSSVAFIVVGLLTLPWPGILCCLLGVLNLFYWWRIFRRLVQVRMDDQGLFISTGAGEPDLFVPYQQIVHVQRRAYMKTNTAIRVVCRNSDGAEMEFHFKTPTQLFNITDDLVDMLRLRAGLG